MLAETLEILQPASGRVLLDGTLGLGGHSAAWLEASAPEGRVIAFDRDRSALERARARLAPFADRAELHHEDYRDCAEILGDRQVDAAMLDLGLGSHQLEDPERGFSFRYDGPLDMRFDRDRPGQSVAEILAQAPAPEIARILSEYGEERAAKRIAREIVEQRQHEPIRTTFQLAELVRRIVPASHRTKKRIDPATRTFQALRIACNQELLGLQEAITTLVERLRPGGRIVVISFHSLEDRVAKHTLRELAETRRDSNDPFAPDIEGPLALEERKARKAGPAETARNPRARSAHLRWGVRR